MKTKTIKKIIKDKITDWWDSIEDYQLREMLKQNTIVTGGCITSLLLKEKVNDFDVYLKTKEAAEAVARYYVSRFQPQTTAGIPLEIRVDASNPDGRVRVVVQSAGIASEEGTEVPYEYFEGAASEDAAGSYVSAVMDNPEEAVDVLEQLEEAAQETKGSKKYRPVFLTSNAISLSNKVQVVLRFYGDPEQIHKNYDYVHCTNYWSSWDDELVLHKDALAAILTKELRYVGSLYPVCSLFRMRKFLQRGWSINAGQILKIVMQIHDLDLKNFEVLKDQLVGVDSAYFVQMMNILKGERKQEIDTACIIEIVDRVF